jgi:isoleucyl-tRNA synthetase
MDYNATINLPKTSFPMRADLPAREPAMLAEWEKERKYYKLAEKNKGKPRYVLHDGPPYANGDIHLGTALNKILKDIIVKYKSMTGFDSPYVPGWDCHGLPIELKAAREMKGNKNDTAELRKICREFALSCLDGQKKQFKRLGVWGDFDDPYLTIAPSFEARQVEVFGEMVKRGYIYKGLKPVHWCADCRTALAEAEIEYQDDKCYSVYVKFPFANTEKNAAVLKDIDITKAFAVIWTTTTWTLPGNLAISLGPNYDYTFIKTADGEFLLAARELADTVAAECGLTDYTLFGNFKGSDLELLETKHPFIDRKSPLITGAHVTLESGTGCVHTAPGFGVEDYEVCNSYKGMFEIIVPVDAEGKLTETAGINLAGTSTDDANKIIADNLKENNLLLAVKRIEHSYPHCWRCHNPIIYRATEQWFCAVEKFRDKAVEAIKETKWIPVWGEERIKNMVEGRSDWCISRQRRWGVPIPVLYCKDCGKEICNDETISAISDLFRKESSDAWYSKEPSEFIPAAVKCECGCGEFRKETDIFDVWFDSGCSHTAVCEQREELFTDNGQADLYLEGADQYRGWFQSSLNVAIATQDRAPYKAVCTHGWVVDGQGKAMHKSSNNSILPEQVIKQYGSDVLRLWVASTDFHSDMRVSNDMLKQISEVYRKIRNTARFILGNLNDFDPNKDLLQTDELEELDKWALAKFDGLIGKVKTAYEEMDYYHAYHAVNHFCVVDMSGFYLDVIKDRLYCESTAGKLRRSAQSAMYIILSGFTRLIAPILVFTSDEIWKEFPLLQSDKNANHKESVIFNQMPEKTGVQAPVEKWDKIHAIREDVLSALEIKRAEKFIGKSLEAKVILHTDEDLSQVADELAAAFIVSQVEVAGGKGEYKGNVENLTISIVKADGGKCERCWTYSATVGENAEHPALCERCVKVVNGNI